MNSEPSALHKIRELKSRSFGEVFLDCSLCDLNYELLFITADACADDRITGLLAAWRKLHEQWFPAQFVVTHEGTRTWLKNGVINMADRLLFMIKVEDCYVGHVGLFRYDAAGETFEIDNIVRGMQSHPGIMESAVACMMEWGKAYLGVKGYSLKTMSDNDRALRLYRKMGFEETGRIPLVKKEMQDRTEWVEMDPGNAEPAEKYYVCMTCMGACSR